MSQRIFRFAPSPNGALHLGHAFSALLNHDLARVAGGRFLLRHEDIDRARCTLAFERGIEHDLHWLGVEWDEAPRRQSEHFADYRAALEALADEGLVYPAFMTRGEVRAFAARWQEENGEPWPCDPDGAPIYPGLDRALDESERRARMADGEAFAWRLDMASACERVGRLCWEARGYGEDEGSWTVAPATPALWGDVVLARKDLPTSYHLSVVVDDALQGVTDVVRGADLQSATSVHRLLQELLGLAPPIYLHHPLILGEDGRKLSKSARDAGLADLRAAGLTPPDIRRMVGLTPSPAPAMP